MRLQPILSRLQKIKRSGDNKYMACCPAHADKTASLTIREESDGRILINCFAGCDTYSILSSIGLDWEDVFPEKTVAHNVKKIDQIIYSTDALKIIKHECRIVMLCAYDIRKGKTLTVEENERLDKAYQLINKAIQGAGE
jgi:hypothetical protein